MLDQWKSLGEFLLVKYADGNVKRERNRKFIDNGWGVPDKIDMPGYSEEYYIRIIEASGDKYMIPTKE